MTPPTKTAPKLSDVTTEQLNRMLDIAIEVHPTLPHGSEERRVMLKDILAIGNELMTRV